VGPALERLRKAADLAPDDPGYHVWTGVALERAGQGAEAAEAYRVAIARGPRLTEGYERLALLLEAQGNHKEAAAQLQLALQAAPKADRLRVLLGDSLLQGGRSAEAVTQYRRALQGDPRLVAVYYKIARAVHDAQGLRAAVPWYEKAAAEEPANPMPHLYLGYAYKERGQKAKAVQAFRTYLEKRPRAEDRKDVEREIEDLGG